MLFSLFSGWTRIWAGVSTWSWASPWARRSCTMVSTLELTGAVEPITASTSWTTLSGTPAMASGAGQSGETATGQSGAKAYIERRNLKCAQILPLTLMGMRDELALPLFLKPKRSQLQRSAGYWLFLALFLLGPDSMWACKAATLARIWSTMAQRMLESSGLLYPEG